MSTRVQIEAAAQALAPDEQVEWIRFLRASLALPAPLEPIWSLARLPRVCRQRRLVPHQ